MLSSKRIASRHHASKRIASRYLLSFVCYALQSKVPMSAITSSMLQNSKYNLILVLDILLLTRVGSLSKKEIGRFSMTTPFVIFLMLWSWFSTLCHAWSDILCYKDNNFGFSKWFPTFWAKKENYYSLLLFICHYSPSLFTGTIHCYCSLRNFAYLRGAVPYIWGKCFLCLVQDFFFRESLPLRAFLCENILAYYNSLPSLQSL